MFIKINDRNLNEDILIPITNIAGIVGDNYKTVISLYQGISSIVQSPIVIKEIVLDTPLVKFYSAYNDGVYNVFNVIEAYVH